MQILRRRQFLPLRCDVLPTPRTNAALWFAVSPHIKCRDSQIDVACDYFAKALARDSFGDSNQHLSVKDVHTPMNSLLYVKLFLLYFSIAVLLYFDS